MFDLHIRLLFAGVDRSLGGQPARLPKRYHGMGGQAGSDRVMPRPRLDALLGNVFRVRVSCHGRCHHRLRRTRGVVLRWHAWHSASPAALVVVAHMVHTVVLVVHGMCCATYHLRRAHASHSGVPSCSSPSLGCAQSRHGKRIALVSNMSHLRLLLVSTAAGVRGHPFPTRPPWTARHALPRRQGAERSMMVCRKPSQKPHTTIETF